MKTNYFLKTTVGIIFIGLILFSCNKDKPQIQNKDSVENMGWQSANCDLTEDDVPAINGSSSFGNQYKNPVFNPNNPYEFAFYKIVKDSNSSVIVDYQIAKYNFINKQETILFTGKEITGRLAWNKYGWIAFKPSEDHFIFIMKDDGSQYSQFSDIPLGPSEFNFTWVDHGNTLLWGGLNVNGQNYMKTKTIGDAFEQNIQLGTTVIFSTVFTISTKSVIVSPLSESSLTFNLTDLSQEEKTPVHIASSGEQGAFFGRINWHPSGDKFYVSFSENHANAYLYEINSSTGAKTKIVGMCNNSIIEEAIRAPFGEYLVLQKIERQLDLSQGPIANVSDIIENSTLWLFNLKTKKEARIF